jgi:hypothetical protein
MEGIDADHLAAQLEADGYLADPGLVAGGRPC